MPIRIGTSGFSYEDWKGRVYPASLKSAEMLPYYGRMFRTVELNTTYYGLPRPVVMEQMAARVPAGFDFAVKAHKDMTHSDHFQPEVFAKFCEVVQPLRDAGMLGPVLAQFPWSFKRSAESEGYLGRLREALPDVPVVVEFRNAGWVDESLFELLRELDLGFCCVDEPRLKGLLPPVAAATSGIGYVRFHGRNAKQWWKHEKAWQRYDYLYTVPELQEWSPKVQEVAAQTETTYVFFNNHYLGQAAQNALQMMDLVGQSSPLLSDETGTQDGVLDLDFTV